MLSRATGRPVADFLGRTNRELGMPEALCRQWDAALRGVFDSGRPATFEFALETPGGPRRYAARLVPGELRFARGDLADVLTREGLPFRPFEAWSDVARDLLRREGTP